MVNDSQKSLGEPCEHHFAMIVTPSLGATLQLVEQRMATAFVVRILGGRKWTCKVIATKNYGAPGVTLGTTPL
jgi:hypothetical protein